MERVAKDLEEVRDELEELNRKWVVSDPFPRSSFHKVVIIALVVTIMGITWEHVTITKCFLAPAQAGWSERSCAVLYPGYRHVRRQSEENLKVFTQLVQANEEDHRKIMRLEQELGK